MGAEFSEFQKRVSLKYFSTFFGGFVKTILERSEIKEMRGKDMKSLNGNKKPVAHRIKTCHNNLISNPRGGEHRCSGEYSE